MSKVKIETLTPVHIGSGNMLYKGMDYVLRDGNAYLLDNNKLLDVIGVDKIDAWVAAIERGENISDFISRIGKNTHPREYSRRTANCYVVNCGTIKENIHDGRGLAYIPGSSIKGAIRTAVLAAEVKGKERELGEKIDFRGGRYASQACNKVENHLFSKPAPAGSKGITESNTSCMRFLQIGDAFFESGCESVLNAINLNIRESKDSLVDSGKPQAIETLDAGAETVFELRLKTDAMPLKSGVVQPLPPSMKSMEALFATINNHTISLLKEEVEYWRDISKEKTGADSYIEFIEDILGEAEDVQCGKECVLRIGHASGWRFTTGAWTEKLDCFDNRIVPMARPNNSEYTQYDFPKSRRVYEIEDNEVDILGFVKLTLV